VIATSLSRRAEALRAERAGFVVATVVRAQRPSSARAGDAALVLADGTIEGFVGGTCAEQSVRLQALRALETGEPLLLRILPGDGEAPASEGAVTVQNPCLSGGALEIFLEPVPPAPRVVVVGPSPVAAELAHLGAPLGLDVDGDGAPSPGDLACVVASHGREELEALRAALEAGVPYVGLVASAVRGAAVADELIAAGLDVSALETPAGLKLGARTPAEIALSILARVVEVRRAAVAPVAVGPVTTIDPVCGMTVAIAADTPRLERDGDVAYFCCDGCRSRFVATH
jgi:xanthine dehydrogenase accessory factor